MVAGSLMHVAGSDRIARWEGIGRREPMLMFTFGLAGVSLMGLPPSGGFIAKWLLLNAAVESGRWDVAVVILAGGLLASVYVFRIIAMSLSAAEPQAASARLPRVMRWPPLVLALVATASGVVTPEPIRLLDIGSPFAVIAEARP
jgi:formate hydrogenlyase subunit 3/multisubunit Na+/H+ antiporter MnhD subunit